MGTHPGSLGQRSGTIVDHLKERTGLAEELREHVTGIPPEHLEIQTEDPDRYPDARPPIPPGQGGDEG